MMTMTNTSTTVASALAPTSPLPKGDILGYATAPAERRAVLLETAALADWLRDRIPVLEKEWKKHRELLREQGELP